MEENKRTTKEQDAVLSNNKKNLLVSASAGTGKTFIMIEYIANLVIKKKIPVKRLLVLTFTKAAASEMKSRLEKKLKEQEFDEFILKQIDDLSIANICTIDSFCEKLVKRYINILPIASGFEIYDPAKMEEIKRQAFLTSYQRLKCEREDLQLEIFASYRSNLDNVKNIMSKIESMLGAVPKPREFLQRSLNCQDDLFDKALEILTNDFKSNSRNLREKFDFYHKNSQNNDNFFDFYDNLFNFIEKTNSLIEIHKGLKDTILINPIPKKNFGEDYEDIKNLKSELSDLFKNLNSLNLDNEEILNLQREGKLTKALIELYLIYEEELEKIKRNKNIISISDLETLASKVCESMKAEIENLFDYIFVDEFQDTNKVQEALIHSICDKAKFFAVGDAKQGIYGFRLASSEIILNMFDEFKREENSDALLLRKNFRTEKQILDFVNFICKKVINLDSCGIDYLDTSMLEGDKDFPKNNLPTIRVDVAVKEKKEKELASSYYSVLKDQVENENTNLLEIKLIESRIEELLKSEIYDEEIKGMRKVQYKDIAILFRKRAKSLDLESYLISKNIPVISDAITDVFDEPENVMLLNFLKTCKNHRDDISLTSTLLSRIGGLTLSELAEIKVKYDKDNFYEYIEEERKNNKKIDNLFKKIEEFNFYANFKGIYFALNKLFDEVDYKAYLKSLNNGENKICAVLNLLSIILSSGYNYDLSGLVSYLEKIEIKISNNMSSSNNAIQIKTIHGTKGLEYPIVILADCGSTFYGSGDKLEIEIDENIGLASKVYDHQNNVKYNSLQMEAIRVNSKKSDLASELMIFYVAMTRAKNMLYLCGTVDSGKLIKKQYIKSCNNYLDLVFYALDNVDFDIFLHNKTLTLNNCEFSLIDEVEEIEYKKDEMTLFGKFEQEDYDKIKDYLEFEYKDKEFCKLKLKNSVTQILETEEHHRLSSNSGGQNFAEEGTLYHEILKEIDFNTIDSISDVKSFLDKNYGEKIDEVNIEIIYNNILLLKNISKNKKIYKEMQFVMQENINNIKNVNCEEKCLVQGIVDFFAIGDESILIDYKYTNIANEEKLIERYKTQIYLYKLAVEKAFNIKLNRHFILSLKNSKLIEVII